MKQKKNKGQVLFVGQFYYNFWYLSRELRKLGWRADLIDLDATDESQNFYHGSDFRFNDDNKYIRNIKLMLFYIKSIFRYDIFHFGNAGGLFFIPLLDFRFKLLGDRISVRLLKLLGKRIVYSNNGCTDGMLRSTCEKYDPMPGLYGVCRNDYSFCDDKQNSKWGEIRNLLADYQINLCGNFVDYNDNQTVHDVPEAYCLDQDFWSTELEIPSEYLLGLPDDTFKIYHSIGNFDTRSSEGCINIKCTHIYLDLIKRLKREGYNVEMIFCKDVPNKDVRYYQAQADVIVDMLTFGIYGANIREGLMLGKPCICYLRPEWMENIEKQNPDYWKTMPIVSATPETIYSVLKDLIENKEKREEIGRKSREFAVRFHSSRAGAKRMEEIYLDLLNK